MRNYKKILAISVASISTLAFAPAASACGGFFCNQSAPVDQTGEQILFLVGETHVEAQVLVEYSGPSEDFAWIVPTPSLPEVGVSSPAVFQRLAQLLAPRFQLNWRYTGECSRSDADFGGGFADASQSADAFLDADSDVTSPGVSVILQSQVGPFDYAILRATDTAELFGWLQSNAYDIPDNVAPFVDPYVQMGEDIHFVAFKLQKGQSAGDIRPITLRYEADNPTIPIQLTAVAVQPDMPVVAYVLGEARAVPDNYLHVEINEARIDWLSGGTNYREVVRAAMNEAGGQAFTTDFAGPSAILNDMFLAAGRYDGEQLAAAGDPSEFMFAIQSQGFSGDPILLSLFEKYVPFPQALADSGLRPQDYYNFLGNYSQYWPENFDAAGFASEIETLVVQPLQHIEESLDELPYVTRLYSALSAEEMTLDPAFVQNPELPDVANIRQAEALVECVNGDSWSVPVTIRLTDGRSLVVDRSSGSRPYDGLAAAQRIEQTSANGAPVVQQDNGPQIQSEVAAITQEQTRSLGVGTVLTTETNEEKGCSAGGSAAGVPAIFAALLALMQRRRRQAA